MAAVQQLSNVDNTRKHKRQFPNENIPQTTFNDQEQLDVTRPVKDTHSSQGHS